eukprot:13660858-Alexandrium_andersonii.AAC.1
MLARVLRRQRLAGAGVEMHGALGRKLARPVWNLGNYLTVELERMSAPGPRNLAIRAPSPR